MGYKLKDDLSIAENVTHAQAEISAKADALLEELPQCALNLMKEYENWKSQVEKWNTFSNKCWTGSDWKGYDADPQWESNSFSFSNENSNCKWTNPSWDNKWAATTSIWWFFSKKIKAWHADVAEFMGQMPGEEDLLLMKTKKLTDDRTNTLYKQIVGANHGSADTYLGMAWIDKASSYSYSASSKLAGVFLPNPDISSDEVISKGTSPNTWSQNRRSFFKLSSQCKKGRSNQSKCPIETSL